MAIHYHQSFPFAFAVGFAEPSAASPADGFAYQIRDFLDNWRRNQGEARSLLGRASPVLDLPSLSASLSRKSADRAGVGGSYAVDSYAADSCVESSYGGGS